MAHTVDWKNDGIMRVFTGDLNPEEILASNFEICNQPAFTTIKYIINDFTGVTSITVDNEHSKIIASTDDIISMTKGKYFIAIVATQDEHIALAKIYQNEMKNTVFISEIFKTVKDAQKWVDSK